MVAEITVSREEVLELVRQKIAEKNPQFHIVGTSEIMEYEAFEGVKVLIQVD